MANTSIHPTAGTLLPAKDTRVVTPLAAALTAVGLVVTIVVGSVTLAPTAGALTISGSAPRLDLAISPGTGVTGVSGPSLTLVGQTLHLDGRTSPDPGSLGLVGGKPKLVVSG